VDASSGLRCFGNRTPPAGLADDVRPILELPLPARKELWGVLGPCLAETITPRTEEAIDAFARRFVVQPEALARILRGCRTLLRAAALVDLDGGAFAEDVRKLGDGFDDLAEILLVGYEPAKRQIRTEIIRGALFDHGNVLDGVSWRVERVVTSDHGPLGFPIAVLTLRYADRLKQERLTLQVTPEKLKELRAACDKLLG
jgi:hypothetical protein